MHIRDNKDVRLKRNIDVEFYLHSVRSGAVPDGGPVTSYTLSFLTLRTTCLSTDGGIAFGSTVLKKKFYVSNTFASCTSKACNSPEIRLAKSPIKACALKNISFPLGNCKHFCCSIFELHMNVI